MTRDQAKGCIGIANQELCIVCKIVIKDELTQKLDRYNDTKLKIDARECTSRWTKICYKCTSVFL